MLGTGSGYAAEAGRLVAWIKSARPVTPDGRILLPGEVERETRAKREAGGIPIDDTTVGEIRGIAERFGLDTSALAQP